jgi:hypothetical protein
MIWMAIELSGTISAASVLVLLPKWINKGRIGGGGKENGSAN